ncbi:TraR/DksA family transcriptional regulator [Flavobacterium sp.]|uniref:TraR/DksA family transcriptional regulator n=1 Tax=Flavobacterium sp. TaxID=239 RepID=UPI002A7F12CA|nr:TraR/DksA C4-type zinc finger protein [Flavobacterium sp.]
MKKIVLISFLLFSMVSFSQKKVIQKFETQLEEIEISTVGLDDFVLENSESEFIEIYLYAENLNVQHIVFNETKSSAKISFKIAQFLKKEIEIHKPITERLKRANVQLAIRQEKFIRDLKNALMRIENKTYGVCRVTGKLIQKERLKLVPHATLSIEAKRKQYKKVYL